MLCLILFYQRFRGALTRTYPSLRRLTSLPLCQAITRLMCGFIQISLILLCILLKLDFLDLVHVSFVVLGLSVVGGKYECVYLRNMPTRILISKLQSLSLLPPPNV